MAVRESATGWGGFVIGLLSVLIVGAGIVAQQAAGQARVEQDLKNLREDVSELKADVKRLGTRIAAAPVQPQAVAENAPAAFTFKGLPQPDPADWRDRMISDKCRRCPACCVRISEAALP
jgi:hypothetical protein